MCKNSPLDFTAPKDELRAQAKAARKALDKSIRQQTDSVIAKRLVGTPEFAAADAVMTYLSFGSEVDTTAIIERCWAEGKTVALPRCVPGKRAMTWHVVRNFEQLTASPLGMREPNPEFCPRYDPAAGDTVLALVPGLVFDRQGYRIGYGGGYYDAFLPGFRGTSVGLVRKDFLSPVPLPHEEHDVPVDRVLSDWTN